MKNFMHMFIVSLFVVAKLQTNHKTPFVIFQEENELFIPAT